MNQLRKTLAVVLTIAFTMSLMLPTVSAQTVTEALTRGYRTGYSDGYMAGYRDSVEKSERNYQKRADYQKADRAYSKNYGSFEEYRDGYQQGFEVGYNSGYDRQSFDGTLPTGLKKRGAVTNNTSVNNPKLNDKNKTTNNTTVTNTYKERTIIIPANTEIVVELLTNMSTSTNQAGDTFQTRVVAPQEIAGAIVDGKLVKVIKPGRVSRRAEMQIQFDYFRLNESRWANFNATPIEVLLTKNDNIKRVDDEGSIEGKSTLKEDAVKVGVATGAGAGVGAIVGGPVGAGVGAAIGGAFGLGGVLVTRGKHINLQQGQQIRIKSNFETQIR
jgi:hypothetical protein